MFRKFLHFLSSHKLIIFICLVLAAIPFFWFKPGYIDIGGDSTRLYFYDPLQFLKSYSLNTFWPDSLGTKSNGTYSAPFVLFLAFLKFFLKSPYILVSSFNGINLVVGFLSIVGITAIFLGGGKNKISDKKIKRDATSLASILAGLFYIFIPISSMSGWDLPLIIQTERFVYPLIFLLLLKYISSSNIYFLLLSLLISFTFAQNFSWVALPNMLSFFSFSFIFLGLWITFFKTWRFPIKKLLLVVCLFFALHAFHYIPLLFSLIQKNTAVTNQLSQGSLSDTLHYVESVASYTRRGYQLIGFTPFSSPLPITVSLIIFPIVIICALIRNRSKRFLFISIFFASLYFFATGDVTKAGFSIFKMLFYIPGFIMFRDFFGRWNEIFLFFYSLTIGFSFYVIFSRFKKVTLPLSVIVLIVLIMNALPFIKGDISNRILTQDTGKVVRSSLKVDPSFNNLLDYLKTYPTLGANITFPIADFTYQIIAGENNDGAYFGPSMVAYLTGKTDIGSSLALRPFTPELFRSAKENNLNTFSNIFPILGVQSVIYDSNPYVYETFATFPYNDVKLYLPKTQSGLEKIIRKLPLEHVKNFDKYYHFYAVANNVQLPIIYVADKVLPIKKFNENLGDYNEKSYEDAAYVLKNFRQDNRDTDIRKVFLDPYISVSLTTVPKISFSRINSSKYIISVKNVSGPYLLVFSQSFNQNWKLYQLDGKNTHPYQDGKVVSYFDGYIRENVSANQLFDKNIFETWNKKPVADTHHFIANAYANSWYISPSDTQGKKTYTLVLEMDDQKYVYIGFIISGLSLSLILGWLAWELFAVYKKNK